MEKVMSQLKFENNSDKSKKYKLKTIYNNNMIYFKKSDSYHLLSLYFLVA